MAKEKNNMKSSNKIYRYIEMMLIFWMAIFAFMNADIQSLWVDELSTVGYIRSGVSFGEMMYTYLFCDTNLPLYSAILYFIYRIIPYGEQYLLIPSIIFCITGIMIFSYCIKKVIGERAGFIVLCLCCASNALIWQGVWEARCYSLTFFLAVITLGCFIKRTQESSVKNCILYSIAVLFFISTHWFACLVLAFYGLTDLFFIISKKYHGKLYLFMYLHFCSLYLGQQ